MLRVGVVGIGFMGKTHVENYVRLESEGLPIRLTALCDIDASKLEGRSADGNINTGTGASEVDYGSFAKYVSVEEMLKRESLDMVDLALPTYLHKSISVMCLSHGVHVLCEKPMALSVAECAEMIQGSRDHERQLMIGQCLRFWPAYEYLRDAVVSSVYGAVTSGYFFRCGATPTWATWLLEGDKSGGAMLDMHIHDTDLVQWLFGEPVAVSTQARNVIMGSGYDIVSTHYRYPDGKVINAQADWTMGGDFGFEMGFHVNFERGNMVLREGRLKVYPNQAPAFVVELSDDMGYYFEQKYFVEQLLKKQPVTRATPTDTLTSVRIVQAEIESANRYGEWVYIQ